VRKWNKFIPEYNAVIQPRNVGRPLEASETQCAQVLKLRKSGMSLRNIADETNLGLSTVRTIVEKGERRDRSTRKHLQRIDPDRAAAASWRARKRTRDALPDRINKTLKTGRDLLKEAKGLGG
jgi:transposase